MRDPARISRILTALQDYWTQYPDLRFGQVIENLATRCLKDCIYHVEDDLWEEWFERGRQETSQGSLFLQEESPGEVTMIPLDTD